MLFNIININILIKNTTENNAYNLFYITIIKYQLKLMNDKKDKNDKNLKSKYKWIEKGKSIWVTKVSQDPQQIFLEAKVLDINQKTHKINVQLIHNKKSHEIGLQHCQKLTYGQNDVSDMVDLQQLNQPQLLFNIKRRYINDLIFTFCGPTLLIINPYMKIEKLFQQNILREYQLLVFAQTLQYKSMVPHVYGLACFCLWQLFDNNRNQSIVISGQSGAGKTENTKFCLSFLASLGKNLKQFVNGNQKSKKTNLNLARLAEKALKKSNKLVGIQDRILGCNQILEAFGNAKTIRNDNSSRFGKLIILLYGQTQVDIRSAFITNYLLQKSRIVSLSDGQRNYHIFYYICKGASKEQRVRYKLTEDMRNYYFLNQSTVYDISQSKKNEDQEKFVLIKKEFEAYLNQSEIDAVLSIVSAVLNLGNMTFSVKTNQKNQQSISIDKQVYLKNVSQLIKADYNQLVHAYRFKTRQLQGVKVDSPLRLDEALALRDSFSKNLYQKLFNFLVFKLNDKIQLQKIDIDDLNTSRSNRKSIGILDIFGFQILMKNSLQQFFINFANQRLQQLYVSYIFKEQQNQFLKQGLKQFAYDLDFQDNKPIIDLIEQKPVGIFHLINQSSELNSPDSSLPQKIIRSHPKSNIITIPKSKPQYFLISHSCSPVQYNVIGFTSKNKDQFPQQMLSIVNKIQNQTMRYIINFDNEKPQIGSKSTKTSSSKKFLGTKFLQQINKLTEQLYSCDCHFVRCIKPNDRKQPRLFYSSSVLQSLRNLGVLDSIRIRKLGYVYRRPYKEFYKKFYEIESYIYNYFAKKVDSKSEDEVKQIAKNFVVKYANKQLQNNLILMGKQKILIKQASLNNLQSQAKEKRRLRVSTANRIKLACIRSKFRQGCQAFFKAFKIFKTKLINFKSVIDKRIKVRKITKIQKAVRDYLIAIRFKKIQKEATKSVSKIGAYWKMKTQRRKYLKIKNNIQKVQSHVRKYLTVVKFFKLKVVKNLLNDFYQITWKKIRNIKATTIQKVYRGWRTRIKFKEVIQKIQIAKKQAIMNIKAARIQKWWRYKMFKKCLNKYKSALLLIQAHWKRYLIRKVYLKVRKSTKIIQRAVKKHLNKKYFISLQWKKYLSNIESFQQFRKNQLQNMKINIKQIKQSKKFFQQSSSRIQIASPAQTMFKYCKQFNVKNKNIDNPNVSLNTSEKNDIQSYILDIDFLTNVSDIYSQWHDSYRAIIKDIKSKNDYPIRIDLSQNFTVVTTQKQKIYCFGEIDPTDKLFINFEIQEPYRIVCNQYCGYIMNTNRKLYVWGDNYNDQLMCGNNQELKFRQNNYLPLQKINDFQIKGSQKYLLSNGKVYQYKQEKRKDKQLFNLKNQLLFKESIQVKQISASYNFVHFLSSTGQIYSKGTNSRGQLGLGHNERVQSPQINKFFKDNKHIVDSVSVGFKHTVCKTRLGYGYAWGDNNYYQVGGNQKFYTIPQLIDIDKPTGKCLHVAAGFRSSMILLQNFKIYGWGTNSTLSLCNNPQKIQYQKMFDTNSIYSQNGLIPVKLSSTWSRSISIFYINAININKCKKNINRQLINKTLKVFSKQWSPNLIIPPYNEQAQINLNLSDMKKFKFKSRALRVGQKIQQSSHKVQQIDLLVQLGKNSSSFNLSAKQKFQDVFNNLLLKDIQKWTDQDKKMYEYLQNPKIQKLIKKL